MFSSSLYSQGLAHGRKICSLNKGVTEVQLQDMLTTHVKVLKWDNTAETIKQMKY